MVYNLRARVWGMDFYTVLGVVANKVVVFWGFCEYVLDIYVDLATLIYIYLYTNVNNMSSCYIARYEYVK